MNNKTNKEEHLLEFINSNLKDWKQKIQDPPYSVIVKEDGPLVLLKYSQLNSDMSYKVTQECRGCILKQTNNEWQYVCRPFDKFFNYGEEHAAKIDWSSSRVTAKIDGSLIKLFKCDGTWHLATNGSINAYNAPISDLGISFGDLFTEAIKMPLNAFCELSEAPGELDPDYTYLFELTSPESQIVIAYEKTEAWYLSRRNTLTGEEKFDRPKFPNVRYPDVYDLNNLNDVLNVVGEMTKDEEGVVVNDKYSNRIKVKSQEYVLAHFLSNNNMVSNRNILEYFLNEQLDDFLSYCPQYKKRADDIKQRFFDLADEIDKRFAQLSPGESRREYAEKIKNNPYKDYCFRKLDCPNLTPAGYLKMLSVPSLMRMLRLKDNL